MSGKLESDHAVGCAVGHLNSSPNFLNKRNRLVGRANESTCFVEGVMCQALLDTGSMVTTISETFYQEHLSYLELHAVDSVLDVKCANDASLPYSGYIEVRITFNSEDNVSPDSDALVLVVPDTSYNRRVPLVIGTNFIGSCLESYSQICQDGVKPSVCAAWGLAYSAMSAGLIKADPILVRLSSGVTVPANCRTLVTARVDTPEIYHPIVAMTEVTEEVTLPGGILVASAVVSLVPNVARQEVVFEVMNLSAKEVTLPAGGVVCSW